MQNLFKLKLFILHSSLFTLYFLLFTILIGCTQKLTQNSKIELRFMTNGTRTEIKYAETVTKEFTEINPEIKIKVETVSIGGLQEKLLTQFVSGTAPDIFFTPEVWIADLMDKGVLLPLDDYVANDKEFDIGDLYSKIVDLFRYKNKLYGLPRESACVILFLNMDLLHKEGLKYPDPNWTWNDFINIAQKLTKDTNNDGRIDQYGYFGPDISWQATRNAWIWQAGGEVFNKDYTKCLLDSPEAMKAIQFVAVDFYKKYKISPSPADQQKQTQMDMFSTGRLGMFPASPPAMAWLRGLKFKWDISHLPRNKKKATVFGAAGWAINSKTKYPAQTWEFLKFLVGKQGQEIMMTQGLGITIKKSLAKSDLMVQLYKEKTLPEHYKVIFESIEYGRGVYLPPNSSLIDSTIQRELERIFYNNEQVEKVCQEITKKINELLK